MKIILTLLTLTMMVGTSAFAQTKDADWVVETGTLLLEGQTAIDLNSSLKAKAKIDPLSTRYQEVTTKKNKFATCTAVSERSDVEQDFVLTKVSCQINAPQGTVNKF